ncbi:glycosyltransferase family 2 protein [Microbacterium pumilum]|uniref:4,4'-diaponeurosporenoate glycosyltransferase n=1 Tax=Microbacterium pumilum TaxID=344165 RepID=A0ABP5E881_9MICO
MTQESEVPAASGTSNRVSVVIPAKDDSDSLARCLAALGAQTRPPDEIIVVDNGSSDATPDVAAAAGATLVRCPEPGIPAASAAAYDHATGELILRLDADCVPSPRWVEAMASAFEERPDVAVFTGGAAFIDGPHWLRRPLAAVYLGAYAVVVTPALGHLPLFGSNLALRRDAWHDVRATVHRHDGEIHDDLDLAFHIGEGHRIRFIRGASMGMSMRPFSSASSLVVRVRRGFRTVGVHWPRDFPPFRWLRLAVRARGSAVRLSPAPATRA